MFHETSKKMWQDLLTRMRRMSCCVVYFWGSFRVFLFLEKFFRFFPSFLCPKKFLFINDVGSDKVDDLGETCQTVDLKQWVIAEKGKGSVNWWMAIIEFRLFIDDCMNGRQRWRTSRVRNVVSAFKAFTFTSTFLIVIPDSR